MALAAGVAAGEPCPALGTMQGPSKGNSEFRPVSPPLNSHSVLARPMNYVLLLDFPRMLIHINQGGFSGVGWSLAGPCPWGAGCQAMLCLGAGLATGPKAPALPKAGTAGHPSSRACSASAVRCLFVCGHASVCVSLQPLSCRKSKYFRHKALECFVLLLTKRYVLYFSSTFAKCIYNFFPYKVESIP